MQLVKINNPKFSLIQTQVPLSITNQPKKGFYSNKIKILRRAVIPIII